MSTNQTRYVTPYKFAQLCGVTAAAINNRIKRGQLKCVDLTNPIDGSIKRYIDLEANPVEKMKEEFRNYPATITRKKKE